MLKFDTNNLHEVMWFQVFLSNTNNLYTIMFSSNYSYLMRRIICLHTVMKHQVFLSNMNNFHSFKYFYSIQIIFRQTYLAHRWDPNRYYHSRPEGTWEFEFCLMAYQPLWVIYCQKG